MKVFRSYTGHATIKQSPIKIYKSSLVSNNKNKENSYENYLETLEYENQDLKRRLKFAERTIEDLRSESLTNFS